MSFCLRCLQTRWYTQEEEYLQQLLERRARERYIQKERNELQKQLKVRARTKQFEDRRTATSCLTIDRRS